MLTAWFINTMPNPQVAQDTACCDTLAPLSMLEGNAGLTETAGHQPGSYYSFKSSFGYKPRG
ncbi:MAG: hypothetical protein OHK0029_37610 [Armatimonadaceae bacterium]